jgi:hypothetical protein
MTALELQLEAQIPERPMETGEHECRPATDAGWIDGDEVDRRPRWVFLLGADPDSD